MKNKEGQVTIFVVIAIVLIVAVVIFFAVRGNLFQESSLLSEELQPVYDSFLDCVEDKTLVGVNLLESQGGYIYLPGFEAGSSYSPFSSQLNFAGSSIPYWYYVSGNNLEKQQVPTKKEMQEQLAEFIEDKIYTCNFEDFYEEGYAVTLGNAEVESFINEGEVEININMNLGIDGVSDSAVVSKHNVIVNTQLGKLYDSAVEVYDYEQETLFLENYAVDTLRNYAPVDGVELQCGPKVWNAEDVFNELEEAIELNTLALRGKNNDFVLTDKANDYFIVDVPVEDQVYFVNSQEWPMSLEVDPTQGPVMISQPVGNQAGMGILGFCYVPYHFVYSVKYPVVVQVVSGDRVNGEIFQFPFAVVVNKNMPREPYEGEIFGEEEIPEFCNYMNTPMQISVYDLEYNPIEADISYQCAGTTCHMGETENGLLEVDFPQCTNGYVIANADGYEELREVISTTESNSYEIFMTPYYEVDVDLMLDYSSYDGEAIVSFVNLENGISRTALYPNQKSVNLSTGQYEIQVYIYRDSEISIPESTTSQCVDVPRSGIGGLFGLTEEECYDVTIPSQIVSKSLYGGGKQNYYVLDEELRNSNVVEVNAGSLPVPISLEQLQTNYMLFEEMGLEVGFR